MKARYRCRRCSCLMHRMQRLCYICGESNCCHAARSLAIVCCVVGVLYSSCNVMLEFQGAPSRAFFYGIAAAVFSIVGALLIPTKPT